MLILLHDVGMQPLSHVARYSRSVGFVKDNIRDLLHLVVFINEIFFFFKVSF